MGFLYLPKRAGPSLRLHDNTGLPAPYLRARMQGSSGHSRHCPTASSRGSERKIAPMTVSSPNVIEIKLNRLIDDMRLLRSQMIAFDKRLKGIEAYLKPSGQQPERKSRPWFAAAASAAARTVLILFAVGAVTSRSKQYRDARGPASFHGSLVRALRAAALLQGPLEPLAGERGRCGSKQYLDVRARALFRGSSVHREGGGRLGSKPHARRNNRSPDPRA